MNFSMGSIWFSEALLPSAFLPRYRGDPLSESRTHADGVFGHIIIGEEGKVDLGLKAGANQFVVIEAKISSRLSSGIKNAPYYDQAARSVACMAEVLRRADYSPWNMDVLGFYILAPKERIEAGLFDKEIEHASVSKKIERRVSEYRGERDEWYERWGKPLIGLINLELISWEDIIMMMGEVGPDASGPLQEYYSTCLKYN